MMITDNYEIFHRLAQVNKHFFTIVVYLFFQFHHVRPLYSIPYIINISKFESIACRRPEDRVRVPTRILSRTYTSSLAQSHSLALISIFSFGWIALYRCFILVCVGFLLCYLSLQRQMMEWRGGSDDDSTLLTSPHLV